MKPDANESRDVELRRALVATAELSAFTRRAPSIKFLIAGIAAFAIAGALAGAAVVTASDHANPPSVTLAGVNAAAQEVAVAQNATLIGAPIERAGSGTTIIRLGTKPAGATNLVVGFECVDHGDFSTSIDGHITPMSCSSSGVLSPQGSLEPTFGSGKHIYKVVAAEGKRFALWISWMKAADTSPSAAQRAELADGIVTRPEYLAAYNRFAGCMAAAGFPIDVVSQASTVIDYSTNGTVAGDAAENRCYPIEFEKVDELWQAKH